MSNYILKYSRSERVRYISHLDFMRTFHRTVRRSGLDMSFSKGFNPHPVMTVAMPLSVGVTSDCEYMKIGFEGNHSCEEIREKLNNAFPKGFTVLDVRQEDGKKYDFAKLNRAVYEVEAECSDPSLFSAEAFMQNPEIVVMKKSKSGEKQANIKPYIYSLDAENAGDGKIKLVMCVAAGNDYNLKADTVIDAVRKYTPGLEIGFYSVHRAKILAGNDELM